MSAASEFWDQQQTKHSEGLTVARLAAMNLLELHLERARLDQEIRGLEGEIHQLDAKKAGLQDVIDELEVASLDGSHRSGKGGLSKPVEKL